MNRTWQWVGHSLQTIVFMLLVGGLLAYMLADNSDNYGFFPGQRAEIAHMELLHSRHCNACVAANR
jgi:hypothetical protein